MAELTLLPAAQVPETPAAPARVLLIPDTAAAALCGCSRALVATARRRQNSGQSEVGSQAVMEKARNRTMGFGELSTANFGPQCRRANADVRK